MKKEQGFRKLNSEVIGMPPITMVLRDIPEPDPGKMNFKKEVIKARKLLFQDSDTVLRLIDRFNKKD